MSKKFSMIPVDVEPVETKYRRIQTQIPTPEAAKYFELAEKYEPVSMQGQPPILWDHAKGVNVYDREGNCWLDFSSGVVVANSGHCNSKVQEAIIETAENGLLHSYCFLTKQRGELEAYISNMVPIPDNRVFLLSTGAETTECAVKLARTYGIQKGGKEKITIIGFQNAFHGRTLGSQMAGGSEGGKEWIVNKDADMQQVPFPNAFLYDWADEENPLYSDEACFDEFLNALKVRGIKPNQIAGIMTETFQGGWVQLMPKGFVKKLREFCTEHDILLIFDEVQAGFGRTGKLFGFLHYEVTPDLICCGKGISSSLPLSCVIGRSDVMNLYGPNEMTSTHSGNPVCSAAALANLHYIVEQDLAGNAKKMGNLCERLLRELQRKHEDVIGRVNGVGLVWGIIFTKTKTKQMDCDFAHDVVEAAFRKGLLFFAPVGSGATIKVCPPLIIEEEALREGISVLDEAIQCAKDSQK